MAGLCVSILIFFVAVLPSPASAGIWLRPALGYTTSNVDSGGSKIINTRRLVDLGAGLMFSSGLASGQLPVDKTSNLLAALGVLVAAAGAFGIGLSKERAAKK